MCPVDRQSILRRIQGHQKHDSLSKINLTIQTYNFGYKFELRTRRRKKKTSQSQERKQKTREAKSERKKIFILKDSYTIKFDVTKTGFGGERGVIL